jgi:hypothetical protein
MTKSGAYNAATALANNYISNTKLIFSLGINSKNPKRAQSAHYSGQQQNFM